MNDTHEVAAVAFDRLEDYVRELPALWGPRAAGIRDFGARWVPAWNAHDVDALDALVTDDVVWGDPAMNGRLVRGRADFRAFAETFFQAFPDVRVEGVGAPYLAVDGGVFTVRSRMTGTFSGELTVWGAPPDTPAIPPTGQQFGIRGIDIYRLRDGLVSEWTLVYDRIDLGRQIGLLA